MWYTCPVHTPRIPWCPRCVLLNVQKHAHDGFDTRNRPGQNRQDPTFKELLFQHIQAPKNFFLATLCAVHGHESRKNGQITIANRYLQGEYYLYTPRASQPAQVSTETYGCTMYIYPTEGQLCAHACEGVMEVEKP